MRDTDRMVIFNTGWMKEYKGVTAADPLIGGGAYPRRHGHGAEILNFQRCQGKLYGFVEPGWKPHKCINIRRLGAPPNPQSVSGILVIWVARHPYDSKTLVVGWYENAKVYRDRQASPPHCPRKGPDGGDAPYCVEVDVSDCLLIPHDKRCFQIHRAAELREAPIHPRQPPNPGGVGQSNVYYGQDWYGSYRIPDLLQYIDMWTAQKHLSVPL